MLEFRPEVLSPTFTKYHIDDGVAIHHFTGPDGDWFHDHPWHAKITVLKGGYIDKVFNPDTQSFHLMIRAIGESFRLDAFTIHKIIKLPQGECVTACCYGPTIRTSRFWQFNEDGILSRSWHTDKWEKYNGERYDNND